jgi:hypothetical protein
MIDVNALLKKAELFEKLAIYGDRRSFLRAIAQEVGQGVASQVLAKLESLNKDLQFVSIDEGLKNRLCDAANNKLSVEEIRQLLKMISAVLTPDHAFLQKSIQEILYMLQSPVKTSTAQLNAGTITPQVLQKLDSLGKSLQFVSVPEDLKNKLVGASSNRLNVEEVRKLLYLIRANLPADHKFLDKNIDDILIALQPRQ